MRVWVNVCICNEYRQRQRQSTEYTITAAVAAMCFTYVRRVNERLNSTELKTFGTYKIRKCFSGIIKKWKRSKEKNRWGQRRRRSSFFYYFFFGFAFSMDILCVDSCCVYIKCDAASLCICILVKWIFYYCFVSSSMFAFFVSVRSMCTISFALTTNERMPSNKKKTTTKKKQHFFVVSIIEYRSCVYLLDILETAHSNKQTKMKKRKKSTENKNQTKSSKNARNTRTNEMTKRPKYNSFIDWEISVFE